MNDEFSGEFSFRLSRIIKMTSKLTPSYLHAICSGMTIDQLVAADGKTDWKVDGGIFNMDRAKAIGDVMEVPSMELTFTLVAVSHGGIKLFVHAPDGFQIAFRPYPSFIVNILFTEFATDKGFFKVEFASMEEVSGRKEDHELMIGQFSTVLQAWARIRSRCMVGLGPGAWWLDSEDHKVKCHIQQFLGVQPDSGALAFLLYKGNVITWNEESMKVTTIKPKVKKAVMNKPLTTVKHVPMNKVNMKKVPMKKVNLKKVTMKKVTVKKVTMKKVTLNKKACKALKTRPAASKKATMKNSSTSRALSSKASNKAVAMKKAAI